jgi:hypothetical protein
MVGEGSQVTQNHYKNGFNVMQCRLSKYKAEVLTIQHLVASKKFRKLKRYVVKLLYLLYFIHPS